MLDALAIAGGSVSSHQDQQVDIRVRVQFAATIAAHCDKANIRVPLKAIPGMAQNQVSKMRALINQLMNIFTLVEALVEMVVGATSGGAEDLYGLATFDIHNKAFLIKEKWHEVGFWMHG